MQINAIIKTNPIQNSARKCHNLLQLSYLRAINMSEKYFYKQKTAIKWDSMH